MSQFILNDNHPLIPREQNYVLEQKIISIHSYDRDISKWPNANHFEIELPENLTNVQSMRLAEITLPHNHYVFTNAYQNIKLIFSVEGPVQNTTKLTITISEGSYTAEQLAIEVATKMNIAVAATILSPYNHFICAYNSVTNTFWFGNDQDAFALYFNENPDYTIPCGQPEVWNHYTKWGLPAYLGYSKKKYISHTDASGATDPSGGFGFDYENTQWLPSLNDASNVHYVDISAGICNVNIFGENIIYMEIEKYNSINELEPFSENTIGLYNNDYAGKINSAFAKIPIGLSNSFSLYGDNKHYFIINVSQFSPPIDRITRLKFTFRFHDGRRVDFKCLPFNFSLQVNMLRDEQRRKMNVRVPQFFK